MSSVARPATEYRLTDEQRDLAARYWGYALTVARRFGERFPDAAVDWDGAAALGLCAAARLYQPSSDTRFEKFLLWRVKGECMDEMRRISGYRKWDHYCKRKGNLAPRILYLQQPTDRSMNDQVSEEPELGWELEWEDLIQHCARLLPSFHGRLLRMLYLHARTSRVLDAARDLERHPTGVAIKHQEALELLKQRYRDKD